MLGFLYLDLKKMREPEEESEQTLAQAENRENVLSEIAKNIVDLTGTVKQLVADVEFLTKSVGRSRREVALLSEEFRGLINCVDLIIESHERLSAQTLQQQGKSDA